MPEMDVPVGVWPRDANKDGFFLFRFRRDLALINHEPEEKEVRFKFFAGENDPPYVRKWGEGKE